MVVAIAEVEYLLQAGCLEERCSVALVGEYGFTQSEVVGIFLVVAGADEVSGVALTEEFSDSSRGKKRAVIQVRRNQGQYFALVWRSRHGPLDHDVRGGSSLGRQLRRA